MKLYIQFIQTQLHIVTIPYEKAYFMGFLLF